MESWTTYEEAMQEARSEVSAEKKESIELHSQRAEMRLKELEIAQCRTREHDTSRNRAAVYAAQENYERAAAPLAEHERAVQARATRIHTQRLLQYARAAAVGPRASDAEYAESVIDSIEQVQREELEREREALSEKLESDPEFRKKIERSLQRKEDEQGG